MDFGSLTSTMTWSAIVTARILISGFWAVVVYVLFAYAFYTMAKDDGIDHAWLAWIPLVHFYLLGELIDDRIPFSGVIIPHAKWILCIGMVLLAALSLAGSDFFIAIFFMIIGWILMGVLFFAALHRLYALRRPRLAPFLTVLSVFLSPTLIALPIICLIVRHKKI